jgi:putative sigma-54 modulation protein
MNVEYTGRQYEVTPAIRKQVETGLKKLTKILGDNFEAHLVLTAEKYRYIADLTLKARVGVIAALAEAGDMVAAIDDALDNIEKQALKNKNRWRDSKRQAKDKYAKAEPELVRVAVGASVTTAVPVVVHRFPAKITTTEAHVVPSTDSVALRPMRLEEAIKEAHFRHHDVFVFRDEKGRVNVLHRTKDGKLELIEVP